MESLLYDCKQTNKSITEFYVMIENDCQHEILCTVVRGHRNESPRSKSRNREFITPAPENASGR